MSDDVRVIWLKFAYAEGKPGVNCIMSLYREKSSPIRDQVSASVTFDISRVIVIHPSIGQFDLSTSIMGAGIWVGECMPSTSISLAPSMEKSMRVLSSLLYYHTGWSELLYQWEIPITKLARRPHGICSL